MGTNNARLSTGARAHDFGGAEALLRRMIESSVDPNVISCCVTIASCARSGDPLHAGKRLPRMENTGMHATLACYEILNKSLAKFFEVPRIEWILEQMRLAGLEASLVLHDILISACAR